MIRLFFLFVIALHAADRWDVQYFYDENDKALLIVDFKFPSPKRGIAAGFIVNKSNPRREKQNATVLITSDGGANWSLVPVKEDPLSLCFLDDTLGWMVTEKGLWQTDEAGRTWKKLSNFPKDMLRVQFIDRRRGWAVGHRKQVFATSDGGATWAPLPAAGEPKVNPLYTTYGWVAFNGARDGIIAGWNSPPRRNSSPVPDWMDPEKAQNRTQLPSTLVLLQTRNGGKDWASTTASIFGRVTRISIGPNGDSLGLVEFNDSFRYPSEVYRFSAAKNGSSERVYRKSDRLITDIQLTDAGTAYFAGSEVTAVVRQNPVPGKLKIIRTKDYIFFEEMRVDYRAEAHRAMIAAPDENNVWVATDTGMILKLH